MCQSLYSVFIKLGYHSLNKSSITILERESRENKFLSFLEFKGELSYICENFIELANNWLQCVLLP